MASPGLDLGLRCSNCFKATAEVTGERDLHEGTRELAEVVYVREVQRVIERVLADPDVDRRNEVTGLISGWLERVIGTQAVLTGLATRVFARNGGAAAAAHEAVNRMLDHRARLHRHPGVQKLLRYVGVFGAPGAAG